MALDVLIFWLKDGFAKGDTIDLSASQVLDESSSSKADRADKARIEAKRLGQEIRNSKSDNVILASSILIRWITCLVLQKVQSS